MVYSIISTIVIIALIMALIYKRTTEQENERQKINELNIQISEKQKQLLNCQQMLTNAREQYNDLINNKMKDIDAEIANQREARETALNDYFNEKIQAQQLKVDNFSRDCNDQIETMREQTNSNINKLKDEMQQYETQEAEMRERFSSLLKPLEQYEQERQARLFYTIQVPEEYRDDISFLLTEMRSHIKHPDVISKIIWTTYVKPYLDDTFRRVDIQENPGIYKLTNLDSGKAYIGKSTNVKKRITDHFKSSIGISTISDQAVHHAIFETGLWNWSIEVIIYCDKDKLSELEKYYINFFNTQTFGYNKQAGG